MHALGEEVEVVPLLNRDSLFSRVALCWIPMILLSCAVLLVTEWQWSILHLILASSPKPSTVSRKVRKLLMCWHLLWTVLPQG